MSNNPFNTEDATAGQREFKLQLAVVKHLPEAFKGSGLQFAHIPNRPGSALDGYFKKQMGAVKGASDLIIGWPVGQCGYIELKAPGETLKTAQNKFLSSWNAIGWRTAVCWSVREVHEMLKKWGLKAVYDTCVEPDYRTEQQKFSDSYEYYKP